MPALNRWRPARRRLSLVVSGALLLGACATTPDEDPLRHTRKLVAEGHASLYRNGAFAVPSTSIRLIPAGPEALDLASELAGMRARQSFSEAIDKAAAAVDVVAYGSRTSYRLAETMHEETGEIARAITAAARSGSVVLVDRSLAAGKRIAGSSWDTARHLLGERVPVGEAMVRRGVTAGRQIGAGGDAAGERLTRATLAAAGELSGQAGQRARRNFPRLGQDFVRAYAALPQAVERRGRRLGDQVGGLDPRLAVGAAEPARALWSARFADLAGDTVHHYGERVGVSLAKAGREIDRHDDGISLAALRSLRWVLQAVVWDATVAPLAGLGTASVGYLGVNLLAYPALVVVNEGKAVTKLAVEVVRDSAGTGWELIAPTGVAAVAALFQGLDYLASQTAAGLAAGGGALAGQSLRAGSQLVGVAVKGGSHAVGAGVEYLGVPLAAAGVAVGGGTVGTVIGGAGLAGGGALMVGGEVAGAGTQVFGNLLAGSTLLGGTAVSAAGGAAYGVYQLSSAVVVPAGYEVGSGLVLSYGTATQLAAQSILAVSDCAYLVLSLEGPRWVIYAVRGKASDGNEVAPGALIDLQALRAAGEELRYLPVSDEEMRRVVGSVYDSLPVEPPPIGR